MKLSSQNQSLIWLIAAALSAGSLGLACGSAATPAEAPEAEAHAEETASAPAGSAAGSEGSSYASFDSLSAPEKMDRMKTVVVPQMAHVFQKLDAEEFAEVSCATCHGPGAKSGDFAMPSASLPLNKHEMEEHPEVTAFMKEHVVPEMARVLGEEPYSPETGKGFGCYGCHTKTD